MKSFKCILQDVRFLLANHTRLSPTSDNESYTNATSFIYSYGFPLVLILIKVCSVRSLLDSFKVLIVIFFGNSVKSDYCQCIVVFVLNLLQNNYDYDQIRTSQEAARKIWMDSRIFLLGVFSTQVSLSSFEMEHQVLWGVSDRINFLVGLLTKGGPFLKRVGSIWAFPK